jgi:putative peptidoglycan lipid II flippase
VSGSSGPEPGTRSLARNTAVFSLLTGLSRVAGLAREVLASAYFGLSAGFSAFTLAFAVPNTVRAFFADAALSSAFVPVVTELLEQKRRKDALQLATTLSLLVFTGLGAVTLLFVVAAPAIMPLLTGAELAPVQGLVNGLSQVLFPIVLLLGLNGLTVGILQSYEHFTIPALSPLVWNIVIMGFLVGGQRFLDDPDAQLYAYAAGIVVATAVQLLMSLPVLARIGFRFVWPPDFGMPEVKRVFLLMLPVTIGLGLINLNVLINAFLGSLVSEDASKAIDNAFRIYMLPQGMFSVAIATVLFPTLSRFAARGDLAGVRRLLGSGMRQVLLLLVPCAALTLALSVPITRLVFQRGQFDAADTELVATALFWFSFSLPTSGLNLLLTRTFFSLQRPWLPTKLAGVNIGTNIAVSAALYSPFGVAGIVAGTAAGSLAMAFAQSLVLRRELGGIDAAKTLNALVKILVASAALAGVSYVVWAGLDSVVGRSLAGQIISVGGAMVASGAVYIVLVRALGVEEVNRVEALIRRRLGRSAP